LKASTSARSFRSAAVSGNPPGRPRTNPLEERNAAARALIAQTRLRQQNDARNRPTFDRNTGTGGRFFSSPALQQAMAAEGRRETRFAGERMREVFKRTDASTGISTLRSS
jgi:hypothetical protein